MLLPVETVPICSQQIQQLRSVSNLARFPPHDKLGQTDSLMFPVIRFSAASRSRVLVPSPYISATNNLSKASPLLIELSNMRLPLDPSQRVKNYIYAAAGFVLLLCWVLTIAVFGQTGSTHGATIWYFVLVKTQYRPVFRSS